MKLALKLGIQTYQILTNHDEVCISSLSSILIAVYSILMGSKILVLKRMSYGERSKQP